MKVQTKFILVFIGYLFLMGACGVWLYAHNRGAFNAIHSESVGSVERITSRAIDYRSTPCFSYLMQLRMHGLASFMVGDRWDGAELEPAVDRYDLDAICLFDSSFKRVYRYAREGALLPEQLPFSLSRLGEGDAFRFFVWDAGRLFEVCVVEVPDLSGSSVGYIATVRCWNQSRLMDLAGIGNVSFYVKQVGQAFPLEAPAAFGLRELKDLNGHVVAHLYGCYRAPLGDVYVDLWAVLLFFIVSACFGGVLIFCLRWWVVFPLHRLEAALVGESSAPLTGLVRCKSEFGKVSMLIERLFARNGELEVARDAAMNANQAKGGFLATMSHEIRTPMNSLMGMIGLLKRGDISPDQSKLIGIMDRSCDSLMTIINDLLDFSRIEAGKLKLNSDEFNLYQLVEDLELAALQLCGDKPIRINAFVDQDLPRWLIGDDVRIRQVLLNLISNAVKFTDVGHVQISVLVQDLSESSCRLLLMVADTGVGIPPEQHASIFHAYAQAVTPDSIILGSGLGLAISKKLVHLMDGIIGLESAPGEGAVFSVELSLPVGRLDKVILPVQSDSILRKVPLGMSVLVVEDQLLNAQVLVRMLDQLGCKADVAENGKAALVKLGESTYDLIFMDCHMPVMDGYECTRRIRDAQDISSVHTPILAVTADAMPGTREQCLEAGMDAYLVKPVMLDKLRDVLGIYGF